MQRQQAIKLPPPYIAVRLDPASRGFPFVAVVARPEEDSAGGHFVTLAEQIDGVALLGALVDADGWVHHWLEVIVGDVERLRAAAEVGGHRIENRMLDERWRALGAMHAASGTSIATVVVPKDAASAESPSLWLDPQRMELVPARDASTNAVWTLCRDDDALEAAGLPPYATTAHRYACATPHAAAGGGAGGAGVDDGATTAFLPLTAGAPTSAQTVDGAERVADLQRLRRFNPTAGPVLVRPCWPLRYEAIVKVLSGERWTGLLHGRSLVDLGVDLDVRGGTAGAGATDEADSFGASEGLLFMEHLGPVGRLVELCHLKLRLWADAVGQVAEAVRIARAPLLNVDADAFRLEVSPEAVGLPTLWTLRVMLVRAGAGVALPITGVSTRHFVRLGDETISIYRPSAGADVRDGRFDVRIRELVSDSTEQTVVEATVTTQERLDSARGTLLWLRLNLGGTPVDLYGRADREGAAESEFRFRSLPQTLAPEGRERLRIAAGVWCEAVPFRVIPSLGVGHDLYALAVLGARTMLVDGQQSLPTALDRLRSLARQVSVEHDPEVPLRQRVRMILARDPALWEALGPHRLLTEPVTPSEALDRLPAELWCDVLAQLVRMIPGAGPDSLVEDLSGRQDRGLHLAFEPAQRAFDDLLRKTRSLMLIDWRANREIASTIRRQLHALAGQRAGGGVS